ncbi:MAG: phenylalanine--tRNA ligase subunit beta [Nitrospirae bacterium]|nr:phenylalanine--tRNA ligase subunit beta [Nitrospirota bacterium]
MLISLEWLKEFISLNIDPHEIAHILTMAGLEVEAIEAVDADYVFEVNVTPNRPDCLSIHGIARELSAITGRPIMFPESDIKESRRFGTVCEFDIAIKDVLLCKRYAGRVIRDVTVSASPDWLKRRLEKCGLRHINNVVDITNYVLLELGHPLHAFDLDTLRGGIINVSIAHKGQSIVTLDGVQRKLPEESLLIWDKEMPVAIAGIMGGKDTEVTSSTKNIFLESAWFEPSSVRRTSKTLGLSSESSYRFERGADIEMIETALNRATFLISKLTGGQIQRKIDVYPERFIPKEIMVNCDKVNRVLGVEIPLHEMAEILKRLNLTIKEDKKHLKITPPSYRLDIERDSDVIEEIARLYGYQRIPSSLPKSLIGGKGVDRKSQLIAKLKQALRMFGFNEAINYSFMNSQYLDTLNIPLDDIKQRAVKIKNPLRKEDSLLRTTLIPSLIENLIHNLSHGIRYVSMFEMSVVFEDTAEALPHEPLHLSGIYYKEKTPSLWKDVAEDFYHVKGALESIFEELKIKGYSFLPSTEPFLHGGKSADVLLMNEKIGFIGALSPDVVEKLNIKPKADLIVFELNMDKLFALVSETVSYEPIPRFPCIERDIALVVDDLLRAGDIEHLIKTYPSEFIEEVSVFDSYKGRNIPDGKKSLAFSIRYRAKDKTLKDEEVENIHQSLVNYLIQKTGGGLRTS